MSGTHGNEKGESGLSNPNKLNYPFYSTDCESKYCRFKIKGFTMILKLYYVEVGVQAYGPTFLLEINIGPS